MNYTHPPTDCTSPERHHITNSADIRAVLQEYWQRSDEIWQALPVTIDGVTYTHWWQLNFEECVLPVCRAEQTKQRFVEAYVYQSLRQLFRGLGGSGK